MTRASLSQARTFYADLCAAYGREEDEAQFGQWADDLRECDPAALRLAVRSIRRTSERFPTLARVLAVVGAVRPPRLADPSAVESVLRGEVECAVCGDTGWQWVEAGRALPEPPMGAHAGRQVRPCPCRAANGLYRARRAMQARQERVS